jgi:hypothetical protein
MPVKNRDKSIKKRAMKAHRKTNKRQKKHSGGYNPFSYFWGTTDTTSTINESKVSATDATSTNNESKVSATDATSTNNNDATSTNNNDANVSATSSADNKTSASTSSSIFSGYFPSFSSFPSFFSKPKGDEVPNRLGGRKKRHRRTTKTE